MSGGSESIVNGIKLSHTLIQAHRIKVRYWHSSQEEVRGSREMQKTHLRLTM